MKVLIATQLVIPHVGGSGTHVQELIVALEASGHEVHLIHGGQTELPRWYRALRLATFLGNWQKYTPWHLQCLLGRQGRFIRRELDAFRPDIIHCHDVYAASVAVEVAASAVPVVLTVHGPALYEAEMMGAEKKPRFRQMILDCERRAMAGAQHLIAVDTLEAKILREDYGVDPAKITVIFNCVDVHKLRRICESEPFFQPGGPYFLVPRRLVAKTGVRYAIEAMARLNRPDVHLVIAGDGPLRGELEQLGTSLGIASRVHFLGPVPRERLIPLFARAQAVVVPSVPASGVIEATSLAVTEAMACGTVPLASGIGGLAELIENEKTGLLVPPGDPEALAEAMRRILDDAPGAPGWSQPLDTRRRRTIPPRPGYGRR